MSKLLLFRPAKRQFKDNLRTPGVWEVFAFIALAMLQRPERVSLTANRRTQPGRLRSRQHAATSTVMRATNPDRYPPQNMCMISVTNWRTPTQKETWKTQTARVAWMCGRVRDKNSTCINHVVLCCGGIDLVKVLIKEQIHYATRWRVRTDSAV